MSSHPRQLDPSSLAPLDHQRHSPPLHDTFGIWPPTASRSNAKLRLRGIIEQRPTLSSNHPLPA